MTGRRPLQAKQRRVLFSMAGALLAAHEAGAQATLEEITVTAQRREQSLADVPLSVSALSAAALERAGVQDIHGVAMQIPSLSVQTSVTPGSLGYRLRNVGNIGNIAAFEPAVGSFVDDIFRARSSFGSGDLVGVERIEVLRGPQSTLYGKNSTAGVVAIYTQKPGEKFQLQSEASLGESKGATRAPLMRAKVRVGGPITETLRASISSAWSHVDELSRSATATPTSKGYGQDRVAVRADAYLQPNERFDARLIAGHVEDDSAAVNDITVLTDAPGRLTSGFARTSLATAISLQERNASLGVPNGYLPCADNDANNFRNCRIFQSQAEYVSNEAALILHYRFANGLTLTSNTSWDGYSNGRLDKDVMQIRSPAVIWDEVEEGSSYQQELRLTSPGDQPVDWLAGAFYYRGVLRRNPDASRPLVRSDPAAVPGILAARALGLPSLPATIVAPGQAVNPNMRLEDEYIGVFDQATWNVSERLALTAGVRWQREWKKLTQASFTNGIDTPSIANGAIVNVATNGADARVDREVTWSITPQWRFNDDFMMFLTAAEGFKAGGYDIGNGALGPADREYEDEHIRHYEAGVKMTVFDGRVQLNAAAFRTGWEDYQDAAFLGTVYAVGNADRVELKGGELEGDAQLTEQLALSFGVTYANLKYEKFTHGQCNPLRTFRISNPGAVAAGATPQCDLSGQHPYYAPEWSSRLGLQHASTVSWGEVTARVDWSWVDNYNTSFSADPRLIESAHSIINLRIGTRIARSAHELEVIAWVDNLTDKVEHLSDANVAIFGGDLSYQSYLARGRSVGLTVRAKL